MNTIILLSALITGDVQAPYPIVCVRAPRYGERNTQWTEVRIPVQGEPGSDLVLINPDGTEEVLLAGGPGAYVDPLVSFDGKKIYGAYFHDLTQKEPTHGQPITTGGSDIFVLDLETREVTWLTHGETTPNTGVLSGLAWERAKKWKPHNLGICELPGGRLMFTSSRNYFDPTKTGTFPCMQLFVMDADGSNVEQVGYLNLGSALHPVVLTDGTVMWSSYEPQGLRDNRVWGLWRSKPDGRTWEPLISAFDEAMSYHFQAQSSDGSVHVVNYYNLTNNGFGSIHSFPLAVPPWALAFGSYKSFSNPTIQQGISPIGEPVLQKYPFFRYGAKALTPWTWGADKASPKVGGQYLGKVTHPSGAPGNKLLMVYSPGPCNEKNRPVNLPWYQGQIVLADAAVPTTHPQELQVIKSDPRFNYQQPHAVVPYFQVYGIAAPAEIPWLPSAIHAALPKGSPFGIIGTSSFYNRASKPGNVKKNWFIQGSDVGVYDDSEIEYVRIVLQDPNSFVQGKDYGFSSAANERLRILGDIPLRKTDASGNTIIDSQGNPDTSFAARIPADQSFTFQMLDAGHHRVLTMAQTWHQVRPGEVRVDCGGCHAHDRPGLAFESTYAATPEYQLVDLTSAPVTDREWNRDVVPILLKHGIPFTSATPTNKSLIMPFQSRLSPFAQYDYTDDERRTVCEWIDLGAPVSNHVQSTRKGWWADETRPTIHVESPRRTGPITEIVFGVTDAYSGVASVTVTCDWDIGIMPAGLDIANQFDVSDSVWTFTIPERQSGTVTVTATDVQGNKQQVIRSFK